jgi:uncharacterized metal-binding protein
VEHLPETAGLILAYFYFLLAVFSPALVVWAVVRFLRDVRLIRITLQYHASNQDSQVMELVAAHKGIETPSSRSIANSAFGR